MAAPARPTSLRVAALQLRSANDDVLGNLERAVPNAEAAAAAGAQLLLLPEMYSSGYTFTQDLWRTAERLDGPTRRFASALAARLRVHVGLSFLEARGEHFCNTFILLGPAGELVAAVRKTPPPALEAFLFAPGVPRGGNAHVFACPSLGGVRVAVGICYENQLAATARAAADDGADILLMPHSAPRLEGLPSGVVERYQAALLALPRAYASALGIPVVFCNKGGPWASTFPFVPFFRFQAGFAGGSQIVDAGGAVVAPPPAAEEAVLVADVCIPPPGAAARSLAAAPAVHAACRSAYYSPFSSMPRGLHALFAVDEFIGGVVYRCSRARAAAARAVSGGADDDVQLQPLLGPRARSMLAAAAVAAAAAAVAVRARRLTSS